MNKKKEVRNMKDEEKLLNAIHENHKIAYERTKAIKDKELKNKKRKETIVSILIILTFVTLMILNGLATDKAIAECVHEGYSQSYCTNKLA